MGIPFTQVAPTDCGLTLIFPEVDHRVRGVPLAIRADLSGADPLCFQIPPDRDRVPPNRGMASSHRPEAAGPQYSRCLSIRHSRTQFRKEESDLRRRPPRDDLP